MSITMQEIYGIVKTSLLEIVELENIQLKEDISERTPIYGNRGYLDSLPLVTLIASVEEKFSNKGINITIASEKAFSREISPFLTTGTLTKFIDELLKESIHE